MTVHQTGAFVAIFDGQGRILLVRQTYAGLGWSLPGGRVEIGETGLAAGVREVWEETGLVIAIHVELGNDLKFTKGDDVYPVRLFLGDVVGGTLRPDNVEVSACEWFALDKLPPDTYPAQRRLIERAATAL